MKNLSLLIAFAGGAIAGAVIGVMLAPDKGENTRKKICDMANDKAHHLKYKVKDFLSSHGIDLDSDQIDKIVDDIMRRDGTANEF